MDEFIGQNSPAKPKKRSGSPLFYDLLETMAATHDKKSHDYAHDNDPYGNYTFAGLVSAMFAHSPDDAGFAGRVAEKIYRLSVLGKRAATPRNESVEDTETDIAVISALWMVMRREKRQKEREMTQDQCAEEASPAPPRFTHDYFAVIDQINKLSDSERDEVRKILVHLYEVKSSFDSSSKTSRI